MASDKKKLTIEYFIQDRRIGFKIKYSMQVYEILHFFSGKWSGGVREWAGRGLHAKHRQTADHC